MRVKRLIGLIICGGSAALATLACARGPGASERVPVNVDKPAAEAFEFRELGYDGSQARHLDLIAKSPLALSGAEQALLGKNGFVISERKRYRTFAHGYVDIYKNDLPVYVSADSILDAVHKSFDTILKDLEQALIVPEFARWLDGAREQLRAGKARPFGEQAERDLDVYLAVPAALLLGKPPELVLSGDATAVTKIVDQAQAATGIGSMKLFGQDRGEDFSQWKPRGHYEGNPTLERYFRAMMWFGRVSLRIVDVDTHGKVEFQRRSIDGMLALQALQDADAKRRFNAIDRSIAAFMGERDSMSFPELERLLAKLSNGNALAAQKLPDRDWLRALERGGFGAQRIASELRGSESDQTLPRARVFSAFGQRFVIDSEVFSNLVYDRVNHAGAPKRLMPNPLDVAATVFDNGQAKVLLEPELKRFGYERELNAAQGAARAQPAAFWNGNLYHQWLASLRELSPGHADAAGLPSVARTEPWARRLLNTQLASWAELRHDTILYAKQSYTMGVILCEFPDAYVDPYPEFYARLSTFARAGRELSELARAAGPRQNYFADRLRDYFEHLDKVSVVLRGMAERQRRGEEFSAEQLTFVNEAVQIQYQSLGGGCGGGGGSKPYLTGWYAGLFYDRERSIEFEPTIADVHTQPTDEDGNVVGRVLHVGTGQPRMMVVTVDTCKGPSSYVGLSFSYYEDVTSNFKRYNDKEWASVVDRKTSPAWQQSLMARN